MKNITVNIDGSQATHGISRTEQSNRLDKETMELGGAPVIATKYGIGS